MISGFVTSWDVALPEDEQAGIEWYRKAATQGYQEAARH
jgi:TPR repeat protein